LQGKHIKDFYKINKAYIFIKVYIKIKVNLLGLILSLNPLT